MQGKARIAQWFTYLSSPSPASSSTSCRLMELLLQLGWAFSPQPQVSCEMHPCQILPCTALLFCGQSREVFVPELPSCCCGWGSSQKLQMCFQSLGRFWPAEQPASCLASLLAQQTQLPVTCSPLSLSWLLPRFREGVVAQAEIWYRTLQTVKIFVPHSFKCCHLKAIPRKLLFPLLHSPVACQHPR